MKLAGKVALQKSYQAHKFWYELLPLLKSYFSFAPNRSKFLHRFSFSNNEVGVQLFARIAPSPMCARELVGENGWAIA